MENENTKNILITPEKKEELKRIWAKIVDKRVKAQKRELKHAAVKLRIASIFLPAEAPVLNAIASFLKSSSGKKLTNIADKGYEAIGEVLKGNVHDAKNQMSDTLKLYSIEDGEAIALDIKNLQDTIGGLKKW